MNKHLQYNADRLETARMAKDRARRLAFISSLCAVALGFALAIAVGDYWWQLPAPARLVGIGGLGLIGIFGCVRLWHLLYHPTSAKQVALELETQRPELGCVVSTAAEYLEGGRTASQKYEPELVEALQEQAAKRLLVVETNYYRKLAISGGSLAAVVAACLLFVVFDPDSMTALARVTAPWSGKTYTRVAVKPGDAEIRAGENQPVQTVFSGRLPKDARLRWREASAGKWHTVAMSKDTNGGFESLLQNVRGPLKYQVTGSDAVSPEYTVKTYIPPEIKDFKLSVRQPAYTKTPMIEHSSPSLSVLRASDLTFRITSTPKVATARLRFANDSKVDLAAGSGNVWTGSLKATNDLYYWVEMADNEGHKGGNITPYHIQVLPDEPPKVEILDPGMDTRADPTNKIPLKISVTDDFGVGEIKLVFQKLNGKEQTIVCPKIQTDEKEATAEAVIDLAPLRLSEYEVVAYHAEAKDNNTLDGPGIGKSPVYFVEYTTKGEPLSECHGACQKINLLVLEKQIIAATTAVEEKDVEDKLPTVAAIQRQTKAYAEIFRDSFLLSVSPPEAKTEFADAIACMNEASEKLDDAKRPAALIAENDALEHLYQVTRLLPELEAGMCKGGNGNCVKIVLEAIEKLKESQKKDRQQELPKIIAAAKKLAAQQAALADIYRRSPEKPPGQAKGENPNKPPGVAKSGKGNNGQGGANSAPTEPQEANDSTNNVASKSENPQLDEQQKELSEEANALAEKLRELSGKDPRVSGALSQGMRAASGHMADAAHQIAKGRPNSAMQSAGLGLSGLSSVINELEQLLYDNSRATDMATEEYPKEFQSMISDYLRRLSYAQ